MFAIPIVAILVGGIIAMAKLLIRHRERMAMIKRGMHPDHPPSRAMRPTSSRLLPNTKPAESDKHVFRVNRAGDLAKLIGDADFRGDQFFAQFGGYGRAGALQRGGGQTQRFSAPHACARHDFTLWPEYAQHGRAGWRP